MNRRFEALHFNPILAPTSLTRRGWATSIVDTMNSTEQKPRTSILDLAHSFGWSVISPKNSIATTKRDHWGISFDTATELNGRFILKTNGNESGNSNGHDQDTSSSSIVLNVSTKTGDIVGTRVDYDTLKIPNATTFIIPSTDVMVEELTTDRVKQLIDASDIILLSGGDDLGPHATGMAKDDTDLSRFYGVNHARDQIETKILEEAIDRDDVFLLGICRGLQLLAPFLTDKKVAPVEVEGHRPPPEPDTDKMSVEPYHHNVNIVLPSDIKEAINFPDIQYATSHHHQGILLDDLKPHLDELQKKGWYMALTAHENGGREIVEGMVKVKKDPESGEWRLLGVAVQGHPEFACGKHDKPESVWQQAEADREMFNKWLIDQKKMFMDRKMANVS